MRLDTELLDLEIGNEEQRELGPLKYLAETTGKDMGQIVNWFLLLIIFVFDPLAIAMVVAANFAFAQIKPKTVSKKAAIEEWDEKRIDIIGQNGNDGIHYDQEEMIKKNEELLAKSKEDIYKEKDPPAPSKRKAGKKGYW